MCAFARVTLVLAMFLAAGTAVTVALGDVAAFTATGDIAMGDLEPYRYQNEGGEYWLPIGDWWMDQRAIIRFDVRSLGGMPHLRVNSIVLKFFSAGLAGLGGAQTSYVSDTNPAHTEVHAITATNRDWVEGTSDGYSFIPYGCVWQAKAMGATLSSPTTPWAGSPGLTTAGADYNPTVLATKAITRTDLQTVGAEVDFTFSGSSEQLTGLINSWLVDNYTLSRDNPGLLFFDASAGYGTGLRVGFFSRQCTSPPPRWELPGFPADYQPQLVISYSQAPEPGTLALLATGLIGLLAYAWRKRK